MLLIPTAYAEEPAAGSAAQAFTGFLPFIFIIVLFYFMLIRPQQKRAKEHRQMLSQVAIGDEVVTSSGLMGKIIRIEDQVVGLDLGDSKVRLQKSFIQSVLPKGTLDGLSLKNGGK